MSKKKRRCLVTGGAGFIGSHIVERLIDAGHDVAVVDDLSSGKRDNVPAGVPLFAIDINEPMDEAFACFEPDVVVHQAAQVSVSVSVREPERDARINILGSIAVLRAMQTHGVGKIVYASSGAAYGALETLPLVETLRPQPVSPYGISKHTVEHYLRGAAREQGIEWAALRYANVYGPRQDPHGEAGVVAIFTQLLLSGKRPTIFDDGELTRDYIYVGDVAAANVAAVEADLAGHADPVFNVSTGKSTTVNALFARMREALDADIEPIYGPPRPGDVRHSLLDPSRARRDLGWEARIAIEDGLRRTLDFFAARQR